MKNKIAFLLLAFSLIVTVAILAHSEQLPAPHQATVPDLRDIIADCSIRDLLQEKDKADLVARIQSLENQLAMMKSNEGKSK